MFSFFKKNKDRVEIPNWAYFFDEKEYNEFTKALHHYFSSKNIEYVIENGVLTTNDKSFGYENLGLTNVAQVCKQNESKHYREIVNDHFESMIRTLQFEKEFNEIVHDFEQVEFYIGVRIYPDEHISHVGEHNVLSKKLAGDLSATLVFDLPDTIMNIKPEQVEKWNKSPEELFILGVSNIKEKYRVEISEQIYDDLKIWFIDSPHFFTTNIVFDFENHSELIGSHGSLIGLPHRHAAIIYPIENLEVVQAINMLIPAIFGMNEEGPGSVSNNLFWYHEGVLKNLPYELSDESIQFTPTKEFTDMLNSLAEPTLDQP